MKMKQKGFTLIELIVVIVVLGILAAVASPRYLNFTKDAARASVEGLGGAVESAIDLQYGKAVIAVVERQETSTVNGVDLRFGYPTASSLAASMSIDLNKFTVQNEGSSSIISAPGFIPTTVNLSNACQLTYTQSDAVGERPVVTYQLEGCEKDEDTYELN